MKIEILFPNSIVKAVTECTYDDTIKQVLTDDQVTEILFDFVADELNIDDTDRLITRIRRYVTYLRASGEMVDYLDKDQYYRPV